MKPFYLFIFLALLNTACQPGWQITGENQAKDGATEAGEEDLAATANHETITIKKQSITNHRFTTATALHYENSTRLPRAFFNHASRGRVFGYSG